MLWRDDEDLKHEQEQEMELARCWRDASDDTKSDELKHEPNNELDLARCWRDASNGSDAATAGTKRSTTRTLALGNKTQLILQPSMNAEHLVELKKPP